MSANATVTIIDYGVGNLFSLKSSFAAIGVTATVTADPAELEKAERIILPGEARSPIDPPAICRFANRCPKACELCRNSPLPAPAQLSEEHVARCHLIGGK